MKLIHVLGFATSALLLFFFHTILEYTMKLGWRNNVHQSKVQVQVNEVPTNVVESNFTSNFQKCNRYALVDGAVTGLGHMYSAVVLTYIYALENDAIPLIDRRKFETRGHGFGPYPWSLKKLGLDELQDVGEIKKKVPDLKEIRQLNWTANAKRESGRACNIFFRTCEQCCYRADATKRRFCTIVKNEIYSGARMFFRKLRLSSRANDIVPKLLQKIRSSGYIDVIWHIRYGDISLHKNVSKMFVSQLLQTIHEIFPGRKIKVVVLSERSVMKLFYYKNFKSIGATFLTVDSEVSLELMIHSSVLVASGSSFSAIATMVKTTKSISFQVTPKEGNTTFYNIYDQPFVNERGKVTSHSISELKSRGKIITKAIDLRY